MIYLIETKERDDSVGRYVSSGSAWDAIDAPDTHLYTSARPAKGANIIKCEALSRDDWRYELFAHHWPSEA